MINCVITIYKEPIYQIKRAINSVINQTMGDFKLIIVLDNNNYPEAEEVIKEYERKDNRIMVIINEVNKKVAKSRNIAISHISEGYLVLVDADDEANPDRFEICYNFMEANPDVDMGLVGIRMLLEADHS